MQKKNSIFAFTLAELMIGITLISIMAIGASQLNFSRLSKRQELDIGTVKINTIFEEIRNNALLGKGVGVSLETPDAWKIEISESGSGLIESFYTLDGTNWISYPNADFSVTKPFVFENIECRNLDNTSSGSLSGTGTLIFDTSRISFSGTNCTDSYYKILDFSYTFGDLQRDIHINTLSGVIEVD